MAGKRRAYAVLCTCKEQGLDDALCLGRDMKPALYGKVKQAEETVAYLKTIGGPAATYRIEKAELK